MEWIKKNKKIVIGNLIILVLFVVGLTIILLGNGVKQTKDTITVEAGEELNLKATDFLDIDKEKAEDVSIDSSEVDTSKVGEYQVIATYKDNKYTIKVVVKDTKAPIVELKESVVTISDFAELTEEFLMKTVQDASEYEMSFVGYEKKAELDVVNDEYTESLKSEVVEEVSTEGLVNEVPTEEGVYRSILKFVDKYENETLVEVHIIYDAPDPVVEETTTETNTTTQNGGSTNNSKGNGGSTTSNSGNKNNSSNKGTNSGSTNSGNTTTNNGSSNNSGSTNSGNTTNNGSTGLTGQGEPMTPAQQAAVNAGYYKVATSSKGYSVMVHGGEYEKGMKILEDYLATLGYERIGGSGAWINSANDQYGVYVDFDEIKEIETEDNIVWG